MTRNARLTAAASITGTVKRGDDRTTQALRVDVYGPFGFVDPYRESEGHREADRPAKGKRRITVSYSGTSSTASASKIVSTVVA